MLLQKPAFIHVGPIHESRDIYAVIRLTQVWILEASPNSSQCLPDGAERCFCSVFSFLAPVLPVKPQSNITECFDQVKNWV